MTTTELPDNWCYVEIERILLPLQNGSVIQQGWSPQCEKQSASLDEWGVLKTTAIQEGKFLSYENKKLPYGMEPRPYIEVKPGDILMTCAGPRNRCGVTSFVKETRPKLMMSGKIYRFRADTDKISSSFLEAFLLSQEAKLAIDKMKTGISDSGLNLTHSRFLKLPVPLAPLNEQDRIVAKIEELFSELDKGIESLKTARAQLKVYRQSILKHAFEGKLTADWREINNTPSEWDISELGKCGKWQGGGTPSKAVAAYWDGGNVLWVSPKDMKSRFIEDTQQKITREGVANSPAKIINGPSVLFVVRSGILRRILPIAMANTGVTVNQDMQSVVPSKHTIQFLYWYCEANEQNIRHQCSKDGTTVESIDVAELKRFPVPVPSYPEQDEIVKRIEAQISVAEKIEATIDFEIQKSEALRQSILKKAFSGQLVAQNSADEPASVLLERIRAKKEKTSDKKPKTKRRAV